MPLIGSSKQYLQLKRLMRQGSSIDRINLDKLASIDDQSFALSVLHSYTYQDVIELDTMLWYFIKVVAVYIVACVPAPSNDKFLARIKNCSREQSSIVRHFIHSVWRPVFHRHGVRMPEQCPLHFARDLFAVHELAKRHYRANLWTCGICGKSFYREPYLDLHLISYHKDALTWHDHTVCFSDFCDVFRCEGLLQNRRKKRRGNTSRSFTNRQNAFHDFGINVYEDIDFQTDVDDSSKDGDANDVKSDAKTPPMSSYALMTAPPRHVLRDTML